MGKGSLADALVNVIVAEERHESGKVAASEGVGKSLAGRRVVAEPIVERMLVHGLGRRKLEAIDGSHAMVPLEPKVVHPLSAQPGNGLRGDERDNHLHHASGHGALHARLQPQRPHCTLHKQQQDRTGREGQ